MAHPFHYSNSTPLLLRSITAAGGSAGLLSVSGAGAGWGVNVVAGEALVGVLPATLEGFLRRAAGDEGVAAVANEISPFGLPECVADFEIILGLEELHQGPLQFAVAKLPGDMDRLFRKGIDAGVIHGRR